MAEITLDKLTEGTVEGTGVFDVMMQATKAHLEEEFHKGRIRGTEYAQVYLGSLTAVAQQATAFLLGQQTADKQAELLDAQRRSEELRLQNLVLEQDKLEAEILILNQQHNKLAEEVKLTEQQTANAFTQGEILVEQRDKTTAETGLLGVQKTNAEKETVILTNQAGKLTAETGILNKQSLKLDHEITLTENQSINEANRAAVVLAQADKMLSEKALLDQKKHTETAQIRTNVDGVEITGILGAQKKLYEAQKAGFEHDAYQKTAKMYLDTYNVRVSQGAEETASGAGVDSPQIKAILNGLREKLDDPNSTPTVGVATS